MKINQSVTSYAQDYNDYKNEILKKSVYKC